jgi:hypothetical protein
LELALRLAEYRCIMARTSGLMGMAVFHVARTKKGERQVGWVMSILKASAEGFCY